MAAFSLLAGCSATSRRVAEQYPDQPVAADPQYASIYGEKLDEPYPLPAIPYEKIDRRFLRQVVNDPTGQPPGTLVVDTGNHFLYLTQGNGQAMRYGVGLGRQGFAWSGRGVIQYKRKWPKWTPPVEMVARQPELQERLGLEGSMEPGLKNPLGARAMYIFKDGQDTLYRVHGSPEWWTIGKSVSSGCVRMINQDVVDLFDRVANKTPIVVTNLASGGYEEVRTIDEPQPQPRYTSDDQGAYDQGLGDDPIYRDDRQDNDGFLEGPVY
jgi:lipoprotein-anchoring transpeptidase ErfK/SrfK